MKRTDVAALIMDLVSVTVTLSGCNLDNTLNETTSENSKVTTHHPVRNASSQPEGEKPGETTNDPTSQFIEESKYQGDELELVKIVNLAAEYQNKGDEQSYFSLFLTRIGKYHHTGLPTFQIN